MSEQVPQTHSMVFQYVNEDGVELWHCPICGHTILLEWPPHYRKIVLEAGDETVFHSGGKGGLDLHPMQISQDAAPGDEHDPYLLPWIAWMDSVDFTARWRDDPNTLE